MKCQVREHFSSRSCEVLSNVKLEINQIELASLSIFLMSIFLLQNA